MSTNIRLIRGVHQHHKDQIKPFIPIGYDGKQLTTEFGRNKYEIIDILRAKYPDLEFFDNNIKGSNNMPPKAGRRVKLVHRVV